MNEDSTNTRQLYDWWQQVLAGETAAFEKIHTELFNGLYHYALKLVEDTSLAQDALQELFIRIWTKRHSIGSIEKVKVYFYTTLRRQLLNELRNLKLRRLKIKLLPQADIVFSKEEITIREEENALLKQKILQALNNLPKRQKEVLFLHYFQDLDYTEIAGIMGVRYQSVLNLRQKGLQTLRSTDLISYCLLLLYSFLKNLS